MVARVVVVVRSRETYTRTGDRWLLGLRWLRGVERLISVLGDLWLRWLRSFTRTGRPMIEGVVVVARSSETLTRTGSPDGCRSCEE